MKRSVLFPVVAVLAAACACGGSGGGSQGSAGMFSIGDDEPDHLIPGNSNGAFDEIHALFAPLTKVDQNGKLVYVQAKSVTSPDNKVWTITLRPGWKFHNGEPVTAQSYADAWNATAYGPNAWANNGELSNIEGYPALNPAHGKPKTTKLSGVTVVNDTTLRVRLIKTDSQFPLELCAGQPAFLPLPKVAFKNFKAYDDKPVGDGPFEMDGKWQHDTQINVKRFEGYKGTKPKADKIQFKIYSDLHTAYTDAQGGNVDIVNVPQDKYGQAKSDFPDGYVAYDAPAIDYLGFPLYDKRFQDIRIRKAISMAIDRDAVNKAIFGGALTPATSLAPPAELGAKTGICPECTFDPKQAKKLLAEAGGWKGPMEIWFPSGVGYDQTFDAIANQIRQNLGIPSVKLHGLPGFTQFSDALIKKKVTGLYRGHWGALYPSMQNTLTALFTATGDGSYETTYSNPQVDRLIGQGNAAKSDQAADFYNRAQERIMQDFPVVPLFYAKYIYVHTARVSDVVIDSNQIELDQVVAGG
ncbi:MAG TPA: ABC transporter substrate-binding protein [Mycobacteriales bacterium]|nr:ABC transporter substrate-binding protein [Mycobacteriales bacterium]